MVNPWLIIWVGTQQRDAGFQEEPGTAPGMRNVYTICWRLRKNICPFDVRKTCIQKDLIFCPTGSRLTLVLLEVWAPPISPLQACGKIEGLSQGSSCFSHAAYSEGCNPVSRVRDHRPFDLQQEVISRDAYLC